MDLVSGCPVWARDGPRMVGSEAKSLEEPTHACLSPALANTKRQGRARELRRARPVPDWRIPPCPRPNQVPSPNSKRDCPTHGCGAFFFVCVCVLLFPSSIFSAEGLCWSALTRPLGGGIQQSPAGRIQWSHCWGMKNKSGCWGRGAALEIQHPDMPSPDIRVTSRPSQTWAHGHVHLQILARLSLVLIPPNPPPTESRVSFCGPPSWNVLSTRDGRLKVPASHLPTRLMIPLSCSYCQ